MQQFALLSALFAAGVISKPLHENHAQFHKRQEVVNVATDYAYETAVVTVTYGQEQPSATAAPATSAAPLVVTTVIPPASSAAPATTPSSTFAVPSAAAPSSQAAPSSAAPSASASGSASSGNQFLDIHNNYRSMHGANAMTWSDTLASQAQTIVSLCPSGDNTTGLQNTGSNWAGGTNLQVSDALKMWYDEEQAYASASNNYQSNPQSTGSDTGHFSQMIWQDSKEVGCASNPSCSSWGVQVTCLYSPMGNLEMAGQQSYVQNVFPPKQAGQ